MGNHRVPNVVVRSDMVPATKALQAAAAMATMLANTPPTPRIPAPEQVGPTRPRKSKAQRQARKTTRQKARGTR